VGGIAVVATLVYLSVQVRQNTVAIEASSRQQIVSGYRDANRLWLHPGAARAYSEGLRRFPDMEFEQINLFNTLFSDQALFFQGAFALHETGQLEEETYRAYLDWFASNVATPGGSAWWEQIGRPIFMARMHGSPVGVFTTCWPRPRFAIPTMGAPPPLSLRRADALAPR
jgi:hypothetical protein